MNFTTRLFYFLTGITLGVIVVIFIAQKKKISFPYGPDARTLKSIRVKKHYIFSEEAKNTVEIHNLDSLKIAYLLTKSDVDFSESDTDTSKPCQTYKIEGELNDFDVTLIVKRCDSTATFQTIQVKKTN